MIKHISEILSFVVLILATGSRVTRNAGLSMQTLHVCVPSLLGDGGLKHTSGERRTHMYKVNICYKVSM